LVDLIGDTLFELLVQLVEIVKEARVLDGDDGLCSEILHQRDLLVGERAYLPAIDGDNADQLVVLEHGVGEHRSVAAKFDGGDDKGIAFDVGRYRLDIGNVDHALRRGDTPKSAVRRRSDQFACARLKIRGRRVVSCYRAKAFSLAEVQRAKLGL